MRNAMSSQYSRRDFLASATATAAAVPVLAATGQAPLSGAEPAAVARELVPVPPDIEPLCRLIEEQPRDKVIPATVQAVARGVTPRDFLAAAFMTAIRTWPVDHSVYMMHSVGQLSQDLPAEDRLLPIFWSLDSMKHFKWQYQLKPVKSDRYPTPEKAASIFEEAMRTADRDTAQPAILSLARNEGPQAAFDRFWRWGAGRSGGRNIGHAAIAVANAYRTLEVIGWRHAGPVLQFLTAMGSEKNPAASMGWPLAKVDALRPDWAGGEGDKQTVLQLVELYRKCNPEEAAKTTHDRIAKGELQATPIWDAILLLASEHVIRHKIGGVTAGPLHSVTVADALHTAFHACKKPADRLYLLVEAVHWVSKFYDVERQRKQLREVDILKIAPADLPDDPTEACAEVFQSLPPFKFLEDVLDRSAQDRATAVAFALAQKKKTGEFLRLARQYICRNSTVDAHEVKFPVAALDNYHAISPEWRPHVFASLVHVLHGSTQEENPAVQQARELLRK
jgi:hypothetical protein